MLLEKINKHKTNLAKLLLSAFLCVIFSTLLEVVTEEMH